MIEPAGINQFTGNFEQLEKDISALRSDAIGIRNGGSDVHSRFQMLGAYYVAPESHDLFASTQPVMDGADSFATALESVADALETYAAEARPLAKRLESLRDQAAAFVKSVEGDDDWTYDGDKTDRNRELRDQVSETEAAFRAAERRAAGKISALVNGPKFVVDDGSGRKPTKKVIPYGYDADLLKKAKELPWGTAEEESVHLWEVHRHVKSFVWDGFVVDGVGGALKGLGHLVGYGGSAKEAWGRLADVAGGIGQYTVKPYDWVLDHTIGPDEESAAEKRQKAAAREFAKGVVAWDQWKVNPVRAAGTATFNVVTLGVGPLGMIARGGGAGARAAGIGAKVGTYADPLSAALTVGGKAVGKLPKISDLASRIRGGAKAGGPGVHTVLELDDGSKVRVENGEFIRVDAEGNRIHDTAPEEKSAAERAGSEGAPSPREPALVGAGSRATDAPAAHVGERLSARAGHDGAIGGGTGQSPRGAGEAPGRAGDTSAVHPEIPRSGAGAAGSGHADAGSGQHGGSGPGDLGRTGDNSTGDSAHSPDEAGRAADDASTPSHRQDGSDGGGSGERRELTAEELREIRDQHVRLANENLEWREEYYYSDGRRRDIYARYRDRELTEMKVLANGEWKAKHDMPYGAAETKFKPTPYSPDSAPRAARTHLDDVSKSRKLGMDLTAAEKAYKKNPSAQNLEALEQAKEAFGDRANNSKLGERLGEDSAKYHVVKAHFKGAKWIDLPKTSNGAHAFDQLWELENGELVVVEAKGPKADLDWRQGQDFQNGVKVPTGKMVKQGTREYIETICAEMLSRAIQSPKDGQLALRILDALENKKLQYVMVKANENTGTYAGAMLDHLKIY
ncbi:hypothetical protein [Streptomyces flavofungini]|uniref:hypothetical protein n=1 Tax=Streptomyces flavofungini TaxID=68200 RepID=UPI0025B1CDA2|nr:hypothetical protein [Streptomyces flavofungini]WJV46470.1 hypothetical protein QUY26_13555 [Streptomyces flavofungini]